MPPFNPRGMQDTSATTHTLTFLEAFDNGNSGAAKTINWTNGQKQTLTLTDDVTLTIADAEGSGNFLLKVVQDNVGGRDITWPANVKWPSGTKPAISIGEPGIALRVSIISLFYDGTDYHGVGSLDFR